MTRAEMIRTAPVVTGKTNAQILNDAAAAELEARREGGEPAPEREPGKSALGVSKSFSDYYAEGGGAVESPTAGRYVRQTVREGMRLAVGESFAAEAEAYQFATKLTPRSRFGLPSRAMTGEYGATKGQEHIAFISQMESFRKAESDERFNALWNGASAEQKEAYNKFIDRASGK